MFIVVWRIAGIVLLLQFWRFGLMDRLIFRIFNIPDSEENKNGAESQRANHDDMAKFGIGESEVKYPALVGTPIAIYR